MCEDSLGYSLKQTGAKRSVTKKALQKKVLNRVKSTAEWSNFEILTDVPNVEKMSEVILNFAEPLIEEAGDDDKAYKMAVTLAILVWNVSLMPKDEQDALLHVELKEASGLSAEDHAASLLVAEMLLKRKQKHFKGINRLIVDYEIRCTKKNRHLYVASTSQLPTIGGRLPSPVGKKPWWKRILWWT